MACDAPARACCYLPPCTTDSTERQRRLFFLLCFFPVHNSNLKWSDLSTILLVPRVNLAERKSCQLTSVDSGASVVYMWFYCPFRAVLRKSCRCRCSETEKKRDKHGANGNDSLGGIVAGLSGRTKRTERKTLAFAFEQVLQQQCILEKNMEFLLFQL